MDHGDGVQRVVPTVSVRILDASGGAGAAAREDAGPDVAESAVVEESAVADSAAASSSAVMEIPWVGLRRPALRTADLWYAMAVGAAIGFMTSDTRLGVMSGVFIGLVEWVRSIDRRIPFSFGEGFIGYRSDMGWPHGVQEDDDFHWDWRPHGNASDADTESSGLPFDA
jgi:hypothetical protein